MARSKADRSHFKPTVERGPHKGKPRCQGFRSDGKTQCGNPAADGSDMCEQRHSAGKGGAPLKHGGRSKFLPRDLLEKFLEIEDNEELVVNRDNIRITEVMIRDTLTRLEGTQPAQLWQSAIDLYRMARKGGEGGIEALRQLGKILENGLGKAKAKEELQTLMEQQRRHRETENRRVAMNEANLNLRQANALMVALKAAVDQEVSDPELRKRIAIRFIGLMRAQTG